MNLGIRKEFLLKEKRKIKYISLLLVLQLYAKEIQNELMKHTFSNPIIDIAYVFAVAYLPSLISSMIALSIFYLALSIIKMKILPVHFLEKKYFGLKGRNIRGVAIYSIIIAVALYGIPHIAANEPEFGTFFKGYPLGEITDYSSLAAALFYLVALVPLYILYPLKPSSIAAGFIYGAFLTHIISVRTLQNRSQVLRTCSPPIADENSWVTVSTRISSPMPILSKVMLSSAFKNAGVTSRQAGAGRTDLLGLTIESSSGYRLEKGFYSADIAPMWVVTLPFFVSKIYRVSKSDANVTVIPPARKMQGFHTAPLHTDERSEIVSKKILGSSSAFAGIKEYTPGDPLNRVWWMGFARTGKMLVKTFFGTGEDTIILMPDLSNPDSKKEYNDATLAAMTNAINICSKKDISLSIFPICSYPIHVEATRNRRDLMFFLMNMNTIALLSPKGAELIFESALTSGDNHALRERCNRHNISMSSLYGASSFYGKNAAIFSWERKGIFKSSVERFFKFQKKRSKIILLTDTKVPLDALESFRTMALARKFHYVVIVIGEGGQKQLERMSAIKERHILAVSMTYEDAQKVSKIYSILGGKLI